MAQVNIHASPSEEIIQTANKEYTVIDKRGRVIGIKKPSWRSQLVLAKALGENAKNEVYRQMLYPCFFVTSIDGEPVVAFNTENDLEALFSRLDEDGFEAIAKGITEHFGENVSEEATKEKLKK